MDTQPQLVETPQPHQFEHRYDHLRVTIRVHIEPIPGEDNLYKITDYRRKRDADQKWSLPVKEEIGRQGTLQELTPGPKPTHQEPNLDETNQVTDSETSAIKG